MEENLSKKEQYDIRQQQKREGHFKRQRSNTAKKGIKKILAAVIVLGVLIGGGWYLLKTFSVPEEDIVARGGIHLHPRLIITIKGVEQAIPGNIGLGARPGPYHTHQEDNVLHIEPQGIVTKEAIKLKKFFSAWGETFNRDCIFENCNGPEGEVKMFVNGEPNFDFENYLMQDNDRIEIIYE